MTAAAADICIQITIGGTVESLNLGTSTGIVLGFISCQRLKLVYTNNKARFRPLWFGKLKMRSWRDFYPTKR